MNYTYILECEDHTYYTGWTNDLEKRFQSHLNGKGAKYTKSHRPLRIAYYEMHATKKEKAQLIKSPLTNVELFDKEKFKRAKFNRGLHILYAPSSGKVIMEMNDVAAEILCKDEVFVELPVQNNEDWETHEPVINRNGDFFSVNIASDDHPMEVDHHIAFVILQYEKGYRVVYFDEGEKPEVKFYQDEPVIAVYAYCNQHGLWCIEA